MTSSEASSKSAAKPKVWRLRLSERRALLVILDLIMAYLALVISLLYWGSNLRHIKFDQDFLLNRVPVWFYIMPLIWVVLLIDLYDIHIAGDWKRTIRGVAIAGAIGLGLYLLVYMIYVEPNRAFLPRRAVASYLALVIVLTLVWRRAYIQIFTASQFLRRVLLVGGGKTGQILMQILNNLQPRPFILIGIIDDDPNKQDTVIESYPVLGTSEHLLELVNQHHISDLIVAISGEMNGGMFQVLLDAQEIGVEITRMPVAYEELLGRVPIQWLESDWIIRSFVDAFRFRGFYELWKRIVDILAGLVGSLVFLFFLPLIALVILVDDGKPVFYSQIRSGRGGRPYRILKFRTMIREAEADGKPQWAAESDHRATRVGKFLRRTHLDELPQFLNVLLGEMSLIGPRAERPELVEMFTKHVPFYRARLLVKPGLTGWAQVNQIYAASITETVVKLEYDLYYIKHRNVALDFAIMLRTPSMMLGLRGR